MPSPQPGGFTVYGWLVALWINLISFQYGYHISALNQLQAVLTCRSGNAETSSLIPGPLANCIPMTDLAFGLLTSLLTVGGLAGSLSANIVMDKYGRYGAARMSALMVAVGSGIMGISNSVILICIGRLLVGVGCGIGICLAPIYVAEISPASISGNVGVLVQLGIVIGIMVTQGLGLQFAHPREWRWVLFISFILSTFQFLVSPLVVESPIWLQNHGRQDERKKVMSQLWRDSLHLSERVSDADVEDPLLFEADDRSDLEETPRRRERSNSRERTQRDAVTIPQLLVAADLRKPLAIVCLAMATQQLSGINAVLYYSNSILSKSLPDLGPFVSLGITVVNFLMTFPPVFLINRLGRRQLLALSALGMLVSAIAVGIGLNAGLVTLSSVTIVTFVMSFAIGIGPIPFVMISEVSPPHAVSALSSMGLAFSWISNFVVGLVFLPLRNALSHGDASKEGRVFFIFAAALVLCMGTLFKLYRG